MSPEHADMEADWLSAELFRAQDYARKAYDAEGTLDDRMRRLYLANLIGTLDSLYTHYKVEPLPPGPPGDTAHLPTPLHRHKQRGFWGRLFLGDN